MTGGEVISGVFGDTRSPTVSQAPSHPDFRVLLGESAWSRLPAPVRARFVAAHRRTLYRGQMQEVRASRLGWLFAQCCRLIGTPLAPHVGTQVPTRVRVYEDARGGIVWERRYEFRGRRPVVIRSVKRLDRDGTLLECLRFGLHMRLEVFEQGGALHFLSTDYFLQCGRLRLELPRWFLPGRTHVTHHEAGRGRFRFTMSIRHSRFGEMYYQDGLFSD